MNGTGKTESGSPELSPDSNLEERCCLAGPLTRVSGAQTHWSPRSAQRLQVGFVPEHFIMHVSKQIVGAS